MSQQFKQLEDRISRLETDLAQLRQVVGALRQPVADVVPVVAPAAVEPKRGPGRPKKDQQ